MAQRTPTARKHTMPPLTVIGMDDPQMSTSNSVAQVGLCAALVLALTISLAACAGEEAAQSDEFVADTPSAPAMVGDPEACAHVDAPMLDIPAAADTEPQMRIPVPPGWERTPELDNFEISRLTLAYPVLGPDGRRLNAENVSLMTGPPDVDAQTAFDQMRAGLVNDLGWKDFETTPGTVCGLPAQTHTHAASDVDVGTINVPQRRDVSALHVVTKADGHTYMVNVTVGTMPNDPKYQEDAQTILAGFQVLPPAGH